jgi:polyhydroxyalkanoate synthase subunit PhaE
MKDNPFTVWADQWLEYQRRYQDAWHALTSQSDVTGFSGGRGVNDASPWVAALEQWWKAVQPGTAPGVQDFYTRLIEQGKGYFQMTDGLNKAFQQATAAGGSAARWQEAVNNTLAGLKAVFNGHKPDVQGTARQAIAFWELPLNMWRRTVSSSSVLPGDFLQNVRALGAGQVRDELHGRVDQLLSTPAVGYMREEQEQTQILIKLSIDYQQAVQDYAATYSEIGVKCVEALQEQLRQRVTEGKSVDSLRELYDLWVDSCEQAYGDYVSTDRYVEIYGRLVNSLMALKRHGTMMVDEVLGAMNMPTRSEIDTLHLRQQEVRREIKALQAKIELLKHTRQTKAEQQEAAVWTSAATPKGVVARRKAAAPKSTAKSSAKKESRGKRNRSSRSRS